MMAALLITVVLTAQGQVIELPRVELVRDMETCAALSRQRGFQPPPTSEANASFTYCVAADDIA
jgi:hypothetical protein